MTYTYGIINGYYSETPYKLSGFIKELSVFSCLYDELLLFDRELTEDEITNNHLSFVVEDELRELKDYFDYEYDENNDDHIIIDGFSYPYEMTLSNSIDDEHCMRVKLDNKYYYFG